MRISDWSSDVCSSDLPAGLRKEVSFADVQSDPAATILVRPTIRHDTRRQGELRCNAQLIEQVAGANEFSLREKRSRILQPPRSEEHTSELQSLMRISYAVFCLKKKNTHNP